MCFVNCLPLLKKLHILSLRMLWNTEMLKCSCVCFPCSSRVTLFRCARWLFPHERIWGSVERLQQRNSGEMGSSFERVDRHGNPSLSCRIPDYHFLIRFFSEGKATAKEGAQFGQNCRDPWSSKRRGLAPTGGNGRCRRALCQISRVSWPGKLVKWSLDKKMFDSSCISGKFQWRSDKARHPQDLSG